MALTGKIARDILPLVNDPHSFDLLVEYAEYRISELHKILETTNQLELGVIQGQIKELRRLISLRDEALTDSKKKA